MDTWIRLRIFENGSERNRGMSIVKSRGMAHSNQIREFLITDQGIRLTDVYLGQVGGLLMGSSRAAQVAKDEADSIAQKQEIERKRREKENRLRLLDAQIAALSSELEMEGKELSKLNDEEKLIDEATDKGRTDMARLKKADRLN
jgi:circadian clock protein KaiC